MKTRSMIVVLSVALFIAVIPWLTAFGAGNGLLRAKPSAIAVADVQAIMKNLSENKEVQATLQNEVDRVRVEAKQRQDKINAAMDDVRLFPQGSMKWVEASAAVEALKADAAAWQQGVQAGLDAKQSLMILALYNKVVDSAGKVAKADGFDMVFYKEAEINPAAIEPKAVFSMISMRKLLWSSEQSDLTTEVVQYMNNQFAFNAAPAGPAPIPGAATNPAR